MKPLKKWLIVTQYFYPEHFIINGFSEELKNYNIDCEILTGLPNYPSGKIAAGYSFWSGPFNQTIKIGDALAKIKRVPLVPRGNKRWQLALNYLSFALFGSLRVFFLKTRYDAIFCFAPSPITSCIPAIVAKKKFKIPLYFWVQDLWPESVSAVGAVKNETFLKPLIYLCRWIYIECTQILVPSKGFVDAILKLGVDSEKIKYLPNWAEPFPEVQSRPDWLSDLPKGFCIGFAGNIGKAQNFELMIEAASRLRDRKDIHWVIVGDGSFLENLKSLVAKADLKNNIHLIGRKPYQDMKSFYQMCDVLYFSLKDDEIFERTIPSKVQSYMFAGRPIIAAIKGSCRELLSEVGCGEAVNPDSSKDLVQLIRKFSEKTKVELDNQGLKGLYYAEEYFTRRKVVETFLNFLK